MQYIQEETWVGKQQGQHFKGQKLNYKGVSSMKDTCPGIAKLKFLKPLKTSGNKSEVFRYTAKILLVNHTFDGGSI